ncbi:DUF3891 family protein [Virgibacillus sp. W0181]|uniref:DUF3891 family protein n=1 Tax=Virgibacillus sp. W0181 TaxID=3391581 RepID=UPI003F44DAE5
MIVREHADHFIMIDQHHHAQLSGLLAVHWEERFFPGIQWKDSVLHAIRQHDCGWKAFDNQPFWNDRKNQPYTFVDFPDPAKAILYTHGIDTVEKKDRYAALLCSEHYRRFMQNVDSIEAQNFVLQEEKRQQRLIEQINSFNSHLFSLHAELLKICDNLSLYICLNEPGTTKEKEHAFFKDGFPLSPVFQMRGAERMNLHWQNENTITLAPFPFKEQIAIPLEYKILNKNTISKNGLKEAYTATPIKKAVFFMQSEK